MIHAGTGKGKTLGYLLPLAHRLYEGDSSLKVTLVQPNSLLKTQVESVVNRIVPDFERNFTICTPRHLAKVSFDDCVIDEADLSLSAACLPPKMKLSEFLRLNFVGKRVIYSGATFPLESSKMSIRAQILKYNKETEIVEEESVRDVVERVAIKPGNELFVRFKREEERIEKLRDILDNLNVQGKVMVFIKNKEAMNGLKKRINNESVIVTTDSMSRGIDITDLQHVIHFEPPKSAIDYVHRVGRLNRLNSRIPTEMCRSICLLSEEDLRGGPLFLRLLLNARKDVLSVQNSDISQLFSRNRSINKRIRRGKIVVPEKEGDSFNLIGRAE